jgi:flotillin
MIGDSGASKITKDITNIMAQLPETVKGLTGVDITNILKKYACEGEAAKPEAK